MIANDTVDKNMRIAGEKKVRDWGVMRDKLVPKCGELHEQSNTWRKAFDEYFVERLETRYLRPIEAILNLRCDQGEGFAVVALQCSLIEFLQSTREDLNFVPRNDPGENEYGLGRAKVDGGKTETGNDLIVRFLTQSLSTEDFSDCDMAKNFYTSVRCGLLHEARTTGG